MDAYDLDRVLVRLDSLGFALLPLPGETDLRPGLEPERAALRAALATTAAPREVDRLEAEVARLQGDRDFWEAQANAYRRALATADTDPPPSAVMVEAAAVVLAESVFTMSLDDRARSISRAMLSTAMARPSDPWNGRCYHQVSDPESCDEGYCAGRRASGDHPSEPETP